MLRELFENVILQNKYFVAYLLLCLIFSLLTLYCMQGTASVFAPHRGTTLQAFCDLAKVKFRVDVQDNYDATLWQKHQQVS